MKKSFFNELEPALAFISSAQKQEPSVEVQKNNQTGDKQTESSKSETIGKTLNKQLKKKVVKNTFHRLDKRLNLLISSELFADLSDISRYDGTSVNNLINTVLNKYVARRNDDIQKIRSL